MTQRWTIVSIDSGKVLCPCYETAGPNAHPKDSGWPWIAGEQKAFQIDDVPDTLTRIWTGSAWQEDTGAVATALVAAVKAQAEERKTAGLSTGDAKNREYEAKSREVVAWRTMSVEEATAFSQFAPDAKTLRYPYASRSAAAFGDEIGDAIARFEAAIDRTDVMAIVSATEEKACADIRAAPSVAAMRAVYAAIEW